MRPNASARVSARVSGAVSGGTFALLTLLVAAAGCDVRNPRIDASGRDAGVPMGCGPGVTVYCAGNEEVSCSGGTETGRRNCGASGTVCAPGLGCRACVPNARSCTGNDVVVCNADGTATTVSETCDPAIGETCSSGYCASPCSAAEASNSYIGCEYWPTPTINSSLSRADFGFAVVVSNPQTSPAEVTVTRGATSVATRTVAAGGTEVINLPWVDGLQGTPNEEVSSMVAGGAYRLRSTLPVTVYQFNPLEFEIGRDCPDEDPAVTNPADGICNSFTNDASLLLPTHVLTGNYLVQSFPTLLIQQVVPPMTSRFSSPGMLAITATADATSVMVTFSSPVIASADGAIRAFAAGETGTFTMAQGDVLQILAAAPTTCFPLSSDNLGFGARRDYCDGRSSDLTGTEIRSSNPLSVISGHNCAFVPANRFACDHLEEAMFPLESWGTEAIVSITQPVASEPNVIRILSSHDNNTLTFDPPSVHASVTLARTQFIEFEASASFRVVGTEAFSVAQLLVGQNYEGIDATGTDVGDPSLSLGIPTEQFRTDYAFLAPTTYTRSFVNVTAPMTASVTLDGTPVTGFTPVGSTGFGVARVMISGGSHHIVGTEEFGIVVYGFGAFTSYMYPGGLDLEAIDIPF